MDTRPNPLHELFSRSNSPPAQAQHQQLSNTSSPNHLESLFHQLNAPQQPQQQQAPPQPAQQQPVDSYSAPAPAEEPASPPQQSSTERQTALLSLLSGPPAAPRPAPPSQQIPSPPVSNRSNTSPSHNEAQGKILLEQLMAGTAPTRSTYSESQRGPLPAVPSPPYGPSPPRDGDYRPYEQNEQVSEVPQTTSNQSSSPAVQSLPPPPPQPQQQPQPQQPQPQLQLQSQLQPQPQPPPQLQPQQQQPSSPRKSMFEFTSAFDHLSSQVKKKPVPPQSSTGHEENASWMNTTEQKHQSVDNLLEHLTRSTQASQVQNTQLPPPPYDSYLSGSDFPQAEPAVAPQARAAPIPPPLPPKPAQQRAASPPRASPPKSQSQRSSGRSEAAMLPSSHQALSIAGSVAGSVAGSRRTEKESSPGPRGGYRGKAKFINAKNQSSPSPQMQSVVIDVSQTLEEIQASRDYVKSTAIALVKQEAVFLPGTTIGATHWVAYAMTRGRVRVISRSSGDRTLLQLPPLFSPNASVIDMAVYDNHLAGITSDGGFVLWHIPELFTDDVLGHLLLCVPPSGEYEPLHSVKWHPKDPEKLAVASDSRIYLIDLANTQGFQNKPVSHAELHILGQMFTIPSPLVAFDFDVLNYALATISEDSSLTTWNIHDRLPYTTHKIRGEDKPSSLTFVDGGIVVGRKSGTIFQLLSATTKSVLATAKFINGIHEDPDMFGHVSYDPRIQTLWVANCRRESMIAFKLNIDPAASGHEDGHRYYFDQIVEFVGPKPTIHFVILTADADPHGDEAHAACIAAKVPPGELALVAFSVHNVGVDQILIRKEWFDSALATTTSKLPYPVPEPVVQAAAPDVKSSRLSQVQPTSVNISPRGRVSPSEEVENDYNRDDSRAGDHKGRGPKGKNVNWNQKEESGREKEKAIKAETSISNESNLGQMLAREIKKTEENLHNRISRLLNKEMDKQHQRFEDARAHEQAEDFARQEKILKLISTELTRNTTRVVEMAVKNEVQSSVLPALETITKNEVKAALNDQVGRGLADMINQTLLLEIEKLLLRSDFSGHFAHNLSSTMTPLIERHVKEAIAKTFIPLYSQQSSALHQELLREMRAELHSVKTELTSWQSELSRSHEASIRDLEHTVRTLSDQVKYISMNSSSGGLHSQQTHNSPGPAVPQMQSNLVQPHLRQPNLTTGTAYAKYGQQPQQQPVMHTSWFSTGIAAPQASHPATIPQPPPPPPPPQPMNQDRSPPVKSDQWDEVYLNVLQSQDAMKLRDLLSHTNPEVIMPLNGPSLVSQAVILTLIHRLSAMVGDSSPTDEQFKTSLWWLQRSVALLRPEDKLISDFIPRVIPNVQQLLNTTKQRITILPGGATTVETARIITDIQETLRRKIVVST
ncbi:hypothetical protein APHAL10511_001307 [Amanita phalloides]|nr:hypothetical protein APHAL10511_001307 [Amanita phalloides]